MASHPTFGLLAYGGVLESKEGRVDVQVTGPMGRRVFIGPMEVMVTVDAGSIRSFSYESDTGAVAIALMQLPEAPKAKAAVLWIETNAGSAGYRVSSPEASDERLGWRIPLAADGDVLVELTRS